jgi:transcriptional regulator with XRE-family HTH domain
MKGHRMKATFTKTRAAHSVRLHLLMEQQQKMEIGSRIKELRDNSPETNRSIAEYVGVGERSVAAWLAGGGISYDNAKKVAELFEVDVDYIWRGREKGPTPDLLGSLSSPSGATDLDDRLEWIESALQALLSERGLELDAPPSAQGHPPQTGSSEAGTHK